MRRVFVVAAVALLIPSVSIADPKYAGVIVGRSGKATDVELERVQLRTDVKVGFLAMNPKVTRSVFGARSQIRLLASDGPFLVVRPLDDSIDPTDSFVLKKMLVKDGQRSMMVGVTLNTINRKVADDAPYSVTEYKPGLLKITLGEPASLGEYCISFKPAFRLPDPPWYCFGID